MKSNQGFDRSREADDDDDDDDDDNDGTGTDNDVVTGEDRREDGESGAKYKADVEELEMVDFDNRS